MKTSRPLIVYHHDCTDGFGAAYAAWKVHGEGADYLSLSHKQSIDHIDFSGRDVVVLDFCFSPEVAREKILPHAASLCVRDHHLSALDQWRAHLSVASTERTFQHTDGKLDLFFDLDKSGALLAWEHFHPHTPAPRMIRHISDIDLWRFDMGGTRAFSSYLHAQPFDFKVWDDICQTLERDPHMILAIGQHIRTFNDMQVDDILNEGIAREITLSADVDGATVTASGLAVNASTLFASDLGNRLAERSGTFGIVWQTDGKIADCSIRSVAGFDCIPFARAQGGGGHPQACGFRAPLDLFLAAVRGEKPL